MKSPALLEAIRKAGSVGKLAALIGVTSQAVSQWKKPPATRVLDIERETGVRRYDLRPDIYPVRRRKADKAAPPPREPVEAA